MSAGDHPLFAVRGLPAAATLSPAAAGPLHPICTAAVAGALALAALLAGAHAEAQTAQAAPGASSPAEVSPVIVTGAPAQARRCAAPPASPDKPAELTCALDRSAQAAQAAAGRDAVRLAPSAQSPTVSLGVVNTTALAQQFGANLGKSVTPQRPAPPSPAPSPFTRRP